VREPALNNARARRALTNLSALVKLGDYSYMVSGFTAINKESDMSKKQRNDIQKKSAEKKP